MPFVLNGLQLYSNYSKKKREAAQPSERYAWTC